MRHGPSHCLLASLPRVALTLPWMPSLTSSDDAFAFYHFLAHHARVHRLPPGPPRAVYPRRPESRREAYCRPQHHLPESTLLPLVSIRLKLSCSRIIAGFWCSSPDFDFGTHACSYTVLSIDIMDISGEHQNDLTHDIDKHRLTKTGELIDLHSKGPSGSCLDRVERRPKGKPRALASFDTRLSRLHRPQGRC